MDEKRIREIVKEELAEFKKQIQPDAKKRVEAILLALDQIKSQS